MITLFYGQFIDESIYHVERTLEACVSLWMKISARLSWMYSTDFHSFTTCENHNLYSRPRIPIRQPKMSTGTSSPSIPNKFLDVYDDTIHGYHTGIIWKFPTRKPLSIVPSLCSSLFQGSRLAVILRFSFCLSATLLRWTKSASCSYEWSDHLWN